MAIRDAAKRKSLVGNAEIRFDVITPRPNVCVKLFERGNYHIKTMEKTMQFQKAFQKALPGTETKQYWSWRCSCGYDDNRNTDHNCVKCGEGITCQTAGGHHYPAGSDACKDCGKVRK